MTKKVVAIVSVLKPVDDTRNYEKIALSLGNTNKYAINIIGFWSKNIPAHPGITFYPLFRFGRTGLGRLTAPFKILKFLFKVKPELIIATCAESLIVIIPYKIIFGAKVIYDIQENYYRNVRYSGAYHPLIRLPLAIAIRAMEKLSAPAIDYFTLAERVYEKQLHFVKAKSKVIENKAVIPEGLKRTSDTSTRPITFVYSGTIAVHYGIFEAIGFIKRIRKALPGATLHIIGYAPDKKIWQKVMESIRDIDYIKTTGGHTLVAHTQILKELSKAHFCLMPYRQSKSTEGRIPTKLYECLALQTPVIISPSPAWNALIAQNNAGIIHDFRTGTPFPIEKLKERYYDTEAYTAGQWTWEGEKFIEVVERVSPV